MGAVVLLGGRCAQRAAQQYLVLHLLERQVVAMGCSAASREPCTLFGAPIREARNCVHQLYMKLTAPPFSYPLLEIGRLLRWQNISMTRLDSAGLAAPGTKTGGFGWAAASPNHWAFLATLQIEALYFYWATGRLR